ncbi:MAG: hypothetical protein ACRYG8_50215, partial [Janthinobacterium lividum]
MSTPANRTFSIEPAARVSAGSNAYVVEAVLSAETALLRRVDDGSFQTFPLTDLRPESEALDVPAPGPKSRPDLIAEAPKHEAAQKRLTAIKHLIVNFRRPRSEVEKVARQMGVAASTIYDWIRRYQDSPQPSSLIPGTRGPKPGATTTDAGVEAIIKGAIDRNVTVKQRKRVTRVFEIVKDDCRAAGLVPPHLNTVRARVRAIPRRIVLRAQGRGDEARDEFEPRLGKLPDATHPLAVVQMDHSLADITIVDDAMRESLGRPWITVAMDVYSRMIVGLVVSLEAPSAFAAGRCIANAMLPKEGELAALGIQGEWPCWGAPDIVHVDNAKEFRGETLRMALREHGSDVRFRPVRTPHYGGHIERLMRTFSEAIRTLPGATFSNPSERTGYDSDKEAAMTLAEFEKWLMDYVVNHYHHSPHRGIGQTTPLAMWQKGMRGDDLSGPVPPRRVTTDPERLRLDFLPFVWRTVGRRGFTVDHMTYWTDILRHRIWTDILRHRIGETDPEAKKQKRKFLLRIDPRDIT